MQQGGMINRQHGADSTQGTHTSVRGLLTPFFSIHPPSPPPKLLPAHPLRIHTPPPLPPRYPPPNCRPHWRVLLLRIQQVVPAPHDPPT
jgi:hypothetical protein